MEGFINKFFYQTPLYTYDMTKRRENNTCLGLESRRESKFRTARARSCLRWRGSFYELTSKINLSITADSILTKMFFLKLGAEHSTTSYLHTLRKKPQYEAYATLQSDRATDSDACIPKHSYRTLGQSWFDRFVYIINKALWGWANLHNNDDGATSMSYETSQTPLPPVLRSQWNIESVASRMINRFKPSFFSPHSILFSLYRSHNSVAIGYIVWPTSSAFRERYDVVYPKSKVVWEQHCVTQFGSRSILLAVFPLLPHW